MIVSHPSACLYTSNWTFVLTENLLLCSGLFLLSIIVTAFMGTSAIFICFTLSALYAKRRSYLFLGGKGSLLMLWHSLLKHLLYNTNTLLAITPIYCPFRLISPPLIKHGLINRNVAKFNSFFFSGTLMSGLSLLFLMSVMNMFFGSVMLFKVSEPSSTIPH